MGVVARDVGRVRRRPVRKVVLLVLLVVAGAVLVQRVRSRSAAPSPRTAPVPPPAPASEPPATRRPPPRSDGVTPPAPPTTNGERVVLMSIQFLEERGQEVTGDAVVRHVAAGDIDPDEGTVDLLLHRLVSTGCLGGGGDGPYHLTALGRAALLDGSSARPSPAGDAADELSSPTTDA
jgi:hypothetical protein